MDNLTPDLSREEKISIITESVDFGYNVHGMNDMHRELFPDVIKLLSEPQLDKVMVLVETYYDKNF